MSRSQNNSEVERVKSLEQEFMRLQTELVKELQAHLRFRQDRGDKIGTQLWSIRLEDKADGMIRVKFLLGSDGRWYTDSGFCTDNSCLMVVRQYAINFDQAFADIALDSERSGSPEEEKYFKKHCARLLYELIVNMKQALSEVQADNRSIFDNR